LIQRWSSAIKIKIRVSCFPLKLSDVQLKGPIIVSLRVHGLRGKRFTMIGSY